jgi:glutathione S-transferase
VITLYTFGPNIGLPDASPPCMKAEILLKMAGEPYGLDFTGMPKAPKGKLPFMDDAGTIVADSTFIRWHLEQKYKIDFDAGLTPRERAQAWAFEKLCEDNIYFAVAHARWVPDENFQRGPANFFSKVPAPIRPVVRTLVRRKVVKSLYMQGIGRHTHDEIAQLATRGIDALADQLGDNPWLMGAAPCSADASVFATVAGLLCPVFETPLLAATQRHANLVAYRDRGMARWYPDFKPS